MENDYIDSEKFRDEDDEYRMWCDEQYIELLDNFESMVANEEHNELQN